MFRSCRFCAFVFLVLSFLAASNSFAQSAVKKKTVKKAVLWQEVDIERRDLYFGPGGKDNLPDLSSITFVKEQTGGYSTKYKIKDGSGRTWVAKTGLEAQSETSAVRLLSAIGYSTEVNYLVPTMTIPGKGTFTNVRLEARPDDVKRGKRWRWGRTPFERTRQMKGLRVMMAFINNWDMKTANNVILKKKNERHYVVSDLGVSFGKTGGNSLPLFWRAGRSRNDPTGYANSPFVTRVGKNSIKIHYNGKHFLLMRNFTKADARWLADLLKRLSRKQISDAFLAANYSEADINTLTQAVENRIAQLDRAGKGSTNK